MFPKDDELNKNPVRTNGRKVGTGSQGCKKLSNKLELAGAKHERCMLGHEVS